MGGATFYPPHLKSGISFVPQLLRPLLAVLVLCLAGNFCGGSQYALLWVTVLMVAVSGDFLFQAVGFDAAPRWDLAFYGQSLLLTLFLPAQVSLGVAAAGGIALAAFYRLSGGRSGYVLQPVCVVLALLKMTGQEPHFVLKTVSPVWGSALFVLWLGIYFPRTSHQNQRIALIAALVPALHFFSGMNWPAALLGGAAGVELAFDPALSPLSVQSRLGHGFLVLGMLMLFLPIVSAEEAFMMTGLVSGFLAGWIEERSLKRKNNG